MNKGSSSEKCKLWSGVTLLTAGYYFTHSSFILFILYLSLISLSFSPSDETEYEYSGSEEEDEERDVGEPRSVSSQM